MFLIVTKKKWNDENFRLLNKKFIISSKLNFGKIKKLNPKIIFFIHWSKVIPKKIFQNYLCIQFHASDLPKYRGGSPIQNQILDGHKNTKVSAFKINALIDSGDICLKKFLSLKGSAQEIYEKLEKICIKMILEISSKKKIGFIKQNLTSKIYKRRKPEDSNIKLFKKIKNINVYDFIRAHDADGYPKSFINIKNFKFELFDSYVKRGKIYGKFKCIKK